MKSMQTKKVTQQTADWSLMTQRLTALFGASGIACAAYGAHGVEKWANAQEVLWWQKAASFHLFGTLFLFSLVSLYRHRQVSKLALPFFSFGTLIFSGTLYAMALGGPRILGAITPIGGSCLILGFLSLLKVSSKSASSKN